MEATNYTRPLPSLRIAGRRVWVAVSAAAAAVLGALPHLLHHVGPLAGAALFAGAGGTFLFGALGFLAAIPFLLRLRRHCGGWKVPGLALAAMVVTFAVSTLVIGPALAGDDADERPPASAPSEPAEPTGHEAHH
ncbi:hypothetical protein [Thermoleophilum album]|uniref:Uncharacterized protein n=1 Tax=Thermoleophilum album TaxID=29539 RepID=A0A1H6FZF1_THEAL|nr:hypothetical protein [Thermoleophilum album]SEH16177.1 hypothetical protein SAMN02745716_2104 [Thermoleophilum album]